MAGEINEINKQEVIDRIDSLRRKLHEVATDAEFLRIVCYANGFTVLDEALQKLLIDMNEGSRALALKTGTRRK